MPSDELVAGKDRHFKMEASQIIMDKIIDFFIKSRDFNGIPLTRLGEETKTDYNTTIDIVKQLVTEDKASIQSSINHWRKNDYFRHTCK